MVVRRGTDLVVETLVAAGVRHLFSLSGNQIMSIYDPTISRDIDVIHTRHEATAVHMADVWGRLTGVPGIAAVTAGPVNRSLPDDMPNAVVEHGGVDHSTHAHSTGAGRTDSSEEAESSQHSPCQRPTKTDKSESLVPPKKNPYPPTSRV